MAPKTRKGTLEPRYKCKTCNKLFSRSDSLKRHQAIHDIDHIVRPRKRSCNWCSKAKIKCTGERPTCKACKRRKQPCSYEACRSPDLQTAELAMLDLAETDADPMDETFDFSNLLGGTDFQNVDHNGVMPGMLGDNMDGWPFDLQSVPFSEILNLPPTPTLYNTARWGGLSPPNIQNAVRAELTPAFSGTTSDTLSIGRGDGTGTEERVQGLGSERGRRALGEEQIRTLFPDACLPHYLHPQTREQSNPLFKSHQVQPLTFPNRFIPPTTTRLGNAEASLLSDAYDFAHLRRMLDQTPWPPASLHNALTKEELERCVELYFTNFHPHFPVLHRPTFVVSEAPVVLVLAMATLGACLGIFEGSLQLADCLGEWTRRLLTLLVEYNPKHARADYYLTAQTLQGVFARLTGNAKLFDIIEQQRGALIDSAACAGYHMTAPIRPQDLAGKPVEDAWKIWISAEQKTRLVWLIFEYDAAASVLYNARPYVRLAKLRTSFPCGDELWEAESAADWDRLRQDHALSGPYFPELLDRMSTSEDDSKIRHIRNPRFLKYMMLAVARMQWTWREIPSSTPNHFARSKAWNHHNNVGADIARTMSWLSGTVYSSLKSDISPGDTLRAVTNLHIAHMSHLQSAGELLDWLHPFLRGDNPERDRVEAWRSRWAIQSLSRVRQAAFNCGQLIGLARRYPNCFLQQSYFTFHAGTILWSIAPFLKGSAGVIEIPSRREGSAEPPVLGGGTSDARRSITIDDLPRLDALDKIITPAYADAIAQQSRELTGWLQPEVEDDEGYSAAIDGVPDVGTPDGRRKVLQITAALLKGSASPGIAQRLSAVVEFLLAGQDTKTYGEALVQQT